MALQKQIELDNGMTSEYWVIQSISIAVAKNGINNHGEICVDLYKDEAARRNDKSAVSRVRFQTDPIAFLLASEDNAYITAYNIIKQLDEFTGSIDV